MKYQTDFTGHIYKNGCLLCVLTTIAEERVGKSLDKSTFLNLVHKAHYANTYYDSNTPVLSDEHNKNKHGSFVWDHAAWANLVLKQLGYTKEKLVYVSRIYMPWEKAKGKISFGNRVPCDEIILQILTNHNNGHFRGPNHDPWKSGTKMIDLKSIRYYFWREA